MKSSTVNNSEKISEANSGYGDKSKRIVKRVYVDGIFDLFHVGHLRMIKRSKEIDLGPNIDVHLIVGVVGDKIAIAYKRPPVIPEPHRAEIVEALPWVDEIVVPSPLTITREFAEKHRIDLIVHGFANDGDKKNFEKRCCDVMDLFMEQKYTHNVSTSDIMRKIQNEYKL